MYSRILCHQVGLDKDYKTWHVNNRNMLIYMHSDGGSIVCNEKIYPIKRGMLFFVGSKKYHYTLPDNVDSYERSKVFATNEEMIFYEFHALFKAENAVRNKSESVIRT